MITLKGWNQSNIEKAQQLVFIGNEKAVVISDKKGEKIMGIYYKNMGHCFYTNRKPK